MHRIRASALNGNAIFIGLRDNFAGALFDALSMTFAPSAHHQSGDPRQPDSAGGIYVNHESVHSSGGSGARILVANNTIYNTAETGIEARWGYVTIENNIIDNSASVQIYVRSQAVSAGNITIDYNDYWDVAGGNKVGSWNEGAVQNFSGWKTSCGCDTHSLNADPKFISTATPDFHLQSTSPAINVGTALTQVNTDFDNISRPQGTAYDIGAYEYH